VGRTLEVTVNREGRNQVLAVVPIGMELLMQR
jgi:hypothetical protein